MDCILRRLLTPVPMMDRAGSPVSDDEQRSQGFGSCQERLHAYAADPARISVCARWRRPPRLPSRVQPTPQPGGQVKCHITPQIPPPYLTHYSDRSPGLDALFPHAFTMIAVWSRVPGRLLHPQRPYVAQQRVPLRRLSNAVTPLVTTTSGPAVRLSERRASRMQRVLQLPI